MVGCKQARLPSDVLFVHKIHLPVAVEFHKVNRCGHCQLFSLSRDLGHSLLLLGSLTQRCVQHSTVISSAYGAGFVLPVDQTLMTSNHLCQFPG